MLMTPSDAPWNGFHRQEYASEQNSFFIGARKISWATTKRVELIIGINSLSTELYLDSQAGLGHAGTLRSRSRKEIHNVVISRREGGF
jgi:hypothetical protein